MLIWLYKKSIKFLLQLVQFLELIKGSVQCFSMQVGMNKCFLLNFENN